MSNPFQSTTNVYAVIRIRRGPEVDRMQFVYDDGELIYSTDKKRLYVGDGLRNIGTYGGNLIANKTWMTDNFNKLQYIEKYDCVYRTDSDCGFYILTGDQYNLPSNYLLVGGRKIINDNVVLPTSYTLPNATKVIKGGVIVSDGLKVDQSYIKVDFSPTTLELNQNNQLNVSTGINDLITKSSNSSYGKVKIIPDNGLDINNGNLGLKYDQSTLNVNANNELGVNSWVIDSTLASHTDYGKVKITPNNGLSVSNGNLGIKTDYSLEVNANNELKVIDSIATPLPLATYTQLGKLKINSNAGLDVSSGTLSIKVDNSTIGLNSSNELYSIYSNATASYTRYGYVKIEENKGLLSNNGLLTLNIDNNTIALSSTITGMKLVATTESVPMATYTVAGKVKVDNSKGLNIDGSNFLSVKTDGTSIKINPSTGLYVDPAAMGIVPTTPFTLSDRLGVLAGVSNLTITDGLSVTPTGVLKTNIASSTILGAVKIGSGVKINATTAVLDAKVDTTTITYDGTGALKVTNPFTVTNNAGTILTTVYNLTISDGLNIAQTSNTGTLKANIASSSLLGSVKVGDGLNINSTTGVLAAYVDGTTIQIDSTTKKLKLAPLNNASSGLGGSADASSGQAYQQFPSGMMIQFGKSKIWGTGVQVNLPKAYTNNITSVVVSPNRSIPVFRLNLDGRIVDTGGSATFSNLPGNATYNLTVQCLETGVSRALTVRVGFASTAGYVTYNGTNKNSGFLKFADANLAAEDFEWGLTVVSMTSETNNIRNGFTYARSNDGAFTVNVEDARKEILQILSTGNYTKDSFKVYSKNASCTTSFSWQAMGY